LRSRRQRRAPFALFDDDVGVAHVAASVDKGNQFGGISMERL
jgi:hypothetical protein